MLPGVDVVVGDLEQRATLTNALHDVDAIVFTHGSDGDGRRDAAQRIDYGGVLNVLTALGGRRVRIVLMTSIHMTRTSGAYAELLNWKRRSERLVRASGHPYTIIRPSWFDAVGARDKRVVLEQGDTGDGGIGREQLAELIVESLLNENAVGKTFEAFASAGDPVSDWSNLFAAGDRDNVNSCAGAHDRGPGLTDEPKDVQKDVQHLQRVM